MGKPLKVSPKVTAVFTGQKEGGVDAVRLTAFLSVTGKELGLPSDKPIDVRVTVAGNTSETPPKKK
jgi:hypothetical protein